MTHDALGTYLNDHLAGATLGSDLARQLEDHYDSKPFGAEMSRIADEIDEDRETLVELIEHLDITRNPVKAAGAWVAEKAGRVKFSGLSSGDAELGTFLALESMSLGVEGKRSLWIALQTIAPQNEDVAKLDLGLLISRAENQRDGLERERRSMAVVALAGGVRA